jgi:hypothetical protein
MTEMPNAAGFDAAAHGFGLRVDDLVSKLRHARLRLDTEQALQDDIEAVIRGTGLPYRREVRVAGGRIDFLVGSESRVGAAHVRGIGIEVKIRGGKRSIHRQCAAYCGDPRIGHLVVITATALALPEVMHRTPVTILEIGRAWL